MNIEEDAVVPDDLREVWAAKKHLILSEDGAKIDFGREWDYELGEWTSMHLDDSPLDKVTDAFVISLLSRSVTFINVRNCINLTNASIMGVAAKCPALTSLDVRGCKKLTGEALKAIAANCPSLASLVAVPADLREVWAAKKHLVISEDGTTISFGGEWDYERGGWTSQYLDGLSLRNVTDAFVISLLSSKVTWINVEGCKILTDKAIMAIAAKCPALTSIDVRGCKKLTGEAFKAIAANCPSLASLVAVPADLREFWAAQMHLVISEDGTTISFGAYYEREWTSQHLDIFEQLPKVTDALVASLLSSKATSINLASCVNLTDEAFMAIAAKCPALTILDLRGCKKLTSEAIKAIAANCPSLTDLDVSNCKNLTDEALKAIVANCPKLTSLDAWNCSFTTLPTDIGDRLPNLEHLDLRNNNLTSLPRSIVKLTNLKELILDRNPLQTPPWEIAREGLDAIRTYFEELEKGSTKSTLLKVLIIGDGCAGKTTLRNAFAGRANPHEKYRTTHADIEKVELNKDLILNVYDFGGQEEYLAGQLPYITNLALYLLVVEACYAADEYFENKIERFLVLLLARAPDAVVLLVVSKVDQISKAEREKKCRWLERKVTTWLEEKRREAEKEEKKINILRVQFPALPVSVGRINSFVFNDGVQRLRGRIVSLAKQNPPLLRSVGQSIPTSYQALSRLFGAIAEHGDDELALQAMWQGTARELGQTEFSSTGGAYRPKDKLLELWRRCCELVTRLRIDDPDGIFDVATALWEAQGLIFVDAGLVYFRPAFVVDVVSPLVDHQLTVEMKDVVAFVKAQKLENADVAKLRNELERFVERGEIVTWLLLSFLWRGIGLAKEHYSQVLEMLAASGVIFMLESDENDAFAVVLYRLPRQPDPNLRGTTWPVSPSGNQRELVLKFELYLGCPAGFVERFAPMRMALEPRCARGSTVSS